MGLQLHLLDPLEPAERRRHRSTLYALLFCVLALGYYSAGPGPRGLGLGLREALWLLALACGVMALCLRRSAKGARSEVAPSRPAPGKPGRRRQKDDYAQLATWTLTANRHFSKADLEMPALDFRPSPAAAPRQPQHAPAPPEQQARKVDPWAAALQEFEARDEDRRKRQ
jgi:hypothetical protein